MKLWAWIASEGTAPRMWSLVVDIRLSLQRQQNAQTFGMILDLTVPLLGMRLVSISVSLVWLPRAALPLPMSETAVAH